MRLRLLNRSTVPLPFLAPKSFSKQTILASKKAFTMTPPLSKEPRNFAPLKEEGDNSEAPKLKGVVFDVDGTLCLQQNYMFAEMRRVLNITKGVDILDYCHSLPEPAQNQALESIRTIERTAMADQKPQPGLLPLMQYLTSKNMPKGICTRNFDAPVTHLLEKFLTGQVFEPIVTRDFRPPKPDPAGILHIAKAWGFEKDGKGDASQLIMVGDSIDDMTAGFRAGAATVLLVNEMNAHLAEHEHTDLCISQLDELIGVLEGGFKGRIGRGDEESDLQARAENVLETGQRE